MQGASLQLLEGILRFTAGSDLIIFAFSFLFVLLFQFHRAETVVDVLDPSVSLRHAGFNHRDFRRRRSPDLFFFFSGPATIKAKSVGIDGSTE